MKKGTALWLITAAALVLAGIIIFGGALSMIGWDFNKLSTVEYETNTHEINADFEDISIVSDTALIKLLPSEDDSVKVICYEENKALHKVSVSEGTLKIALSDSKKWYEHIKIGLNFDSPKISVYIPEGEYGSLSVDSHTGNVEIPAEFAFESIDVKVSTGHVFCAASAAKDVKIKTSTGDIKALGIKAGSLDLSVSTGRITAEDIVCTGDVSVRVSTGRALLSGVECKNLSSTGSTGTLSLENVIAKGKIFAERDTGDVKLSLCDAAEIDIKTDTGDVIGTLLSDKVFITETDTGTVKVPKTTEGGKCEITTDTGDIKIEIEK